MDELATYREVVVRGLRFQYRAFLLYDDRVEVQFKWGTHRSQLNLPLKDFRTAAPVPGKTRLTIYKRTSVASVALLLAIIVILLVRASVPGIGASLDRFLAGTVWVLAVPLTITILLSYRFRAPVDLVKFLDMDGKVALDILKSGPDAREFEAFVQKIRKQIKAADRE